MTETPKDRAALVGLMTANFLSVWHNTGKGNAAMEAALRAAEDVGVLSVPAKPTLEMGNAAWDAYNDDPNEIGAIEAANAASPYRRRDDG